ncbi:MAG: hypothetical protein ACYSTT_20410 [Planctomycetota bacterium]
MIRNRINNPNLYIITFVAKYLYTYVSRQRGAIGAIDVPAARGQTRCGPEQEAIK